MRCRIKDAAVKAHAPEAALGVADRFTFGVCGRIAKLDDPARSFADQTIVEDEHGAVRLIAPDLCEALHFIAAAASYRRLSGAPAAADAG